MIWHQLSGAQKELRSMGPNGSLRLQSPLLFSKARRGRKFEHEDSVQIAVTLASEGESRPWEGEGIRLPSTSAPDPFLFPSQGKAWCGDTHRCAQLGHMLFTTRLWPSEQKSRWTHLRANTQRHTAKHAYLEPPRKHHNSYCTQRQFKGFTIYILWCFFIFIPIFLLQGSVTVPALSLSHTHTWLKDIDKICYNEPLP